MFKKGYTLIEMLAVISLLSMTVAFSLSCFQVLIAQAKYVKVQADIKTLQGLAERYRQYQGCYPQDITLVHEEAKDPFTGEKYCLEIKDGQCLIYSAACGRIAF